MNGLLDKNLAMIALLSGARYLAALRWITDSWNANQQFEILKINAISAVIEPINCPFQSIIEVALRYDITKSRKPNVVSFIHVK